MSSARIAFAALIGVVASAATHSLMAQKPPPAYFVAEAVVTNPDADRAVIAKLPDTARRYGGKYLARGGATVAFGGEPPQRMVIVAFDNLELVKAWRSDPQVRALEEERKGIGTTREDPEVAATSFL